MSWKGKKKQRQKAPPPVQPTRRVSDSILMRVLDPHHRESLSDLAELYQKLSRQLGMRTTKYGEYAKVQSSMKVQDHAIDLASQIARWQNDCKKRRVNSKTVMHIIADGASIAQISRTLKLHRDKVILHMRAALTIYSLWRKRCSLLELTTSLNCLRASPRKRSKIKNSPVHIDRGLVEPCTSGN